MTFTTEDFQQFLRSNQQMLIVQEESRTKSLIKIMINQKSTRFFSIYLNTFLQDGESLSFRKNESIGEVIGIYDSVTDTFFSQAEYLIEWHLKSVDTTAFQKLNKNLAYNFDNDVEKYYYGIVSSNEPETKQGFTNYTIKVFDGVDSVDLFTISINTDKSDLNLINKLNRLIDNECEIAFFGKIIENTSYKNKYYKNVYLYKDEYLVIN